MIGQNSLSLDVQIPQPGKYIFVVLYYNRAAGQLQELDVGVVTSGGRDQGKLRLPGCPYRCTILTSEFCYNELCGIQMKFTSAKL